MCLAAFALNAHPRFPVVIAANRDEFFDRPAASMTWWQAGGVDVLAGRDLSAGGTWFGVTREGRLALLTNVREPGRQVPTASSRGALVVDWLKSTSTAPAFAQSLNAGHNGFNLVMADLLRGQWHWHSNRQTAPAHPLGAGVHGLSNAALDTPWPKTVGMKQDLAQALQQATSTDHLAALLFEALRNDAVPGDEALPDTGVGLERERLLAPRFVRMPGPDGVVRYGTRCSTVLITEVLAQGQRQTTLSERTVLASGHWQPEVTHLLPGWP